MYDTEEEAAKAYDDAAVEHFGDKAKRNFDDDGQIIDYNDAANKGRGASKRRRTPKGATSKDTKPPTATGRTASPSPSPSAGAGPIAELDLNPDYASLAFVAGGGGGMFDGMDEDRGESGGGDYGAFGAFGASSSAMPAVAKDVRPPPPPPPIFQVGDPMGGMGSPIPVAVAMKKKGPGAMERKIKSVPPGMRKHLTAAQKGRLGDSGSNSPPPDSDASGAPFDSEA